MSLLINGIQLSNGLSGTGVSTRRSVIVATTIAGTLASDFENGDTVDGIVLSTGDRILIKDQASGIENGIYTVETSGTPTRTFDFYDGTNVASAFVFVQEGTQNADTGWVCTNDEGNDVVGTNALIFMQFAGNGVDGDISGPGSSTDNAIVRWDGTDGDTIQNSGISIDDSNNISGIANLTFESGTFDTTINVTTQTSSAPTITIPDLGGVSGNLVINNATQTLTNKTLTLPQINDTSVDHQYIFAVNELTADRTITLPLLTSNDTFVFEDHSQTLTNKTLTSPIINEILDSNSNEELIFTTTASAVNEFTITNSATGNSPELSVTGDDTNINMDFQIKGSGVYRLLSTASQGSEFRLFEDTDNGIQYIGLKSADSIASSFTLTLPSADGGANYAIITDGAGTLSFGSARLDYQAATSVTDFQTTNSIYTVIGSMTITPASGTYIAVYSASYEIVGNNTEYEYAIHNNGTETTHSTRVVATSGGQTSGVESSMQTLSIETVTGTEAIDVRTRRTSGGGTITIFQRNFALIKLA